MRLLRLGDNGGFSIVEVFGNNIPRYAVLSHTWGADNEEVTFKDIVEGTGKSKSGYSKIRFCGKQAVKDDLQFFWVDTCCIDKSSSAELSEAINSMFQWYRKADKCYVYLSDVSADGSAGSNLSSKQTCQPAFQDCKWFTRGWTLQELLAPTSVEFFSVEGERIGDRNSMVQEIQNITGIPIQALQGTPLSHFSTKERMSWAEKRKTKREEDAAYCMLGIFDIHMPLIYGEGREKAFGRLWREIEYLGDGLPILYKIPAGSTKNSIGSIRDVFETLVPQFPNEESIRPDTKDACLRTLCASDPRLYRKEISTGKGPRVSGTCEWIKSNQTFVSWYDLSPDHPSTPLWISGSVGVGKTMLSIFLAEHLENSKSTNDVFIEYFCDGKNDRRNTPESILMGLIYQLLLSHPDFWLHIREDFRIHETNILSFESLWLIFERMVRAHTSGLLYCIIDGLDECTGDTLESFLSKLQSLFVSGKRRLPTFNFRLIIVSRRLEHIRRKLSGFDEIPLDEFVKTDVEIFIKGKVRDLSIAAQYTPKLESLVEQEFIDRANGTFLWVGIVAKALEGCKTIHVEGALRRFPSQLEQVFAQILMQLPRAEDEFAAQIISWILVAARPLTVTEVSILAQESGMPSSGLSREAVMKARLSVLEVLLSFNDTVDGEEISLIHASAREYLSRNEKDQNNILDFFRMSKDKLECAHLEMASRCLKYLSYVQRENGHLELASGWHRVEEKPQELGRFPMLAYSVCYWPHHAKALAHGQDKVFAAANSFKVKVSPVRNMWMKMYWATKETGPAPESASYTDILSWLGMHNLLSKSFTWWRTAFGVGIKRRQELAKALWWAGSCGDNRTIQLLLNQPGVRTDWKDKEKNETALARAARSGHSQAVKALVEAGATIDAPNKDQLTPLHAAAAVGHVEAIRALIDAGATVDAQAKNQLTPLHLAAVGGHVEAIRALIDGGAIVNALNKYQLTPLHAAAVGGHVKAIRALIDGGATVDALNKDQFTPLHSAAARGHVEAIKALIDVGATVNALYKDQFTPLHVAAVEGHVEAIRALIDGGATADAQTKDQFTPLHAAAAVGHVEAIRALIDGGATVDALNKHQFTPLHVAAAVGHVEAIRALIDAGATVNAQAKNQLTCPHLAAAGDHAVR